MLLFSIIILAHGWYPNSCCADKDCHPVPCEELLEQSDGSWIWDIFRFNRNVVQPSQDRYCHVCTLGPNGLCAFIQQAV